jgi:hypothetical protein
MAVAPENTSVWLPVYPGTVLPYPSMAVIVRLSAAPAVGVVVAASSRNRDIAPAATPNDPVDPVAPDAASVALSVVDAAFGSVIVTVAAPEAKVIALLPDAQPPRAG